MYLKKNRKLPFSINLIYDIEPYKTSRKRVKFWRDLRYICMASIRKGHDSDYGTIFCSYGFRLE